MGTMQVDHAVTVQVMNSCVVKAQQVLKFGSSDELALSAICGDYSGSASYISHIVHCRTKIELLQHLSIRRLYTMFRVNWEFSGTCIFWLRSYESATTVGFGVVNQSFGRTCCFLLQLGL